MITPTVAELPRHSEPTTHDPFAEQSAEEVKAGLLRAGLDELLEGREVQVHARRLAA